MKTSTLISTIVLSAIAVTGTTALAKGGRDHQRASFEQLDADGDGQVTQAEITALRQSKFTSADADGDGQLSLEEMQTQAQSRATERTAKFFERLDANDDGFLSDDELPKPRNASKMFERIDADGNGSISEQEYADAKEKRGHKHKRNKHSGSDSN